MRLADVVALVEGWYPPHRAEEWDSVGLICGDPDAEVRTVLLAVDPVQAVADEAVALGADLVIVHHPLFLRGTTTVAASTSKGRVVHDLITAGCGLLTAHTNADAPAGGVSEAIALALGLVPESVVALQADPVGPMDKVVVFAPEGEVSALLREQLAAAGAGQLGAYDSASFSSVGTGRFRPLAGAKPAIGTVGAIEDVAEERIEVIAPRSKRQILIDVIRAIHPYEEPAYDVIELAEVPDPTHGSGRWGRLPAPMSLRAFADHAAAVFPPTAGGLRVSGDPERLIESVALCGGAGDFLLERARAIGADVYVTSDLRHHPASESAEEGGPALVDVAHWAAESLWLPVLRDRLVDALAAGPDDTVGVSVHVSTINTDPWTFRI